MDALDIAKHDTVHKDPNLSAHEIAKRIGVVYGVLNNKVNWSCETNELIDRESIALQVVTGNDSIIRETCRILGGEFVPNDKPADIDVTTAVLKATAEHGDVSRAIHDALGDGRVTAREAAHINRQIDELTGALQQLKTTVNGIAEGPRPVSR
ncbi:MAG: phage regulatory CII family protein [Pseudomonadota bacterium]